MERVLTPELMDDPAIDREELRRSLAYIRGVNRWLGGSAALLGLLRRWSRSWPRDRPITLLDVGTGSADIPVAARQWAQRAGFDLRVTGVDLHDTTLALAREHTAGVDGIDLIKADARRCGDHFAPGSFDYVHAGMFLHHLAADDVLVVLRTMHRLARRGIVWNDLVRSPLSATVVRLLVTGQPPTVRHDAVVSIRAGFTRREALNLARDTGITYARWSRVMWYRFTLAGEKPTLWDSL